MAYRSNLEKRVAKLLNKGFYYESEKFGYSSHHEYTPDFVRGHLLIEVKGRFRTGGEAAKYIDIRRDNPDYELVFIFQNPNTPMPFTKRRKDGTKFTHAEWATKNGFTFYSPETIPKGWKK